MNPNQEKLSYQQQEDSHNKNCYAYMANMFEKTPLRIKNRFQNQALREFFSPAKIEDYDPNVSYANIYTTFLTQLEYQLQIEQAVSEVPEVTEIPQAEQNTKEKKTLTILDILKQDNNVKMEAEKQYNAWINAIYFSETNILEETYNRFKRPLSERPMGYRPEKTVKKTLMVPSAASHNTTPQAQGSYQGRFQAMISQNFKPMLTTSIPSVIKYQYTKEDSGKKWPQELRFGTQGQRHDGTVRISPIFIERLKCTEPPEIAKGADKITHVYFNLLGRDRTGFEGEKEKALTKSLEELEKQHSNIIVITLPADKGLMDKHDFSKTTPDKNLTAGNAFAEMLEITMGQSKQTVQDFYISPKAKKLLYGEKDGSHNETQEALVLSQMLEKSFKAMGLDMNNNDAPISLAQQQAVWFHFNKYELPNFVLEKLQPKTWNTSCKDAIDRGGVASAYKNLLSSFTTDTPMTHDEFEQALHAAAAVVKGRGLNDHHEVIWNAVNAYVDAQYQENLNKRPSIFNEPNKEWLIHWRNDNSPNALIHEPNHLNKIITQNQYLLKNALENSPKGANNSAQKKALNLGKAIVLSTQKKLKGKDSPINTTGKRLYLEIISQATQLALHPEKEPTKDFGKLCKKLNSDYPALGQIKGALKVLFGTVIAFTAWGKKLQEKGYGTIERYNPSNTKSAREISKDFLSLKEQMRALRHLKINNLPKIIKK